jgi:hypothetical protein
MKLNFIIPAILTGSANSNYLRSHTTQLDDSNCKNGPCVLTKNQGYLPISDSDKINYLPDCSDPNKYFKDPAQIGNGECDDGSFGRLDLTCYDKGSIRFVTGIPTLSDNQAVIKSDRGNDAGDCDQEIDQMNPKSSDLFWISLAGSAIIFGLLGYVLGTDSPIKQLIESSSNSV